MEEVERDRLFYLNSGGGITISGGEPLLQNEFTRELFRACRQKMIPTALDTCGQISWEKLEEVAEFTDLILYDIKHLNSSLHQETTGKGNRLILENLKRASSIARIWVRVPLIPGFNDSTSSLHDLGSFLLELRETKIEKVSLLPYHNWGKQKYGMLGSEYTLAQATTQENEKLEELKQIIESYGISATIGS